MSKPISSLATCVYWSARVFRSLKCVRLTSVRENIRSLRLDYRRVDMQCSSYLTILDFRHFFPAYRSDSCHVRGEENRNWVTWTMQAKSSLRLQHLRSACSWFNMSNTCAGTRTHDSFTPRWPMIDGVWLEAHIWMTQKIYNMWPLSSSAAASAAADATDSRACTTLKCSRWEPNFLTLPSFKGENEIRSNALSRAWGPESGPFH